MKTKFKIFLIFLIIIGFLFSFSTANAGRELLKLIGGNVLAPIVSTWELGSSALEIAKVWIVDLNSSGSGNFGDLVNPGIEGHLRAEKVDIQYRDTTFVPLVTFQFDDGYATDNTIMKPVFDAQGEVACSAIITDIIGTGDKMSWAQVVELQNAGWEIMSHTKSHCDLTGSTDAELIDELGGSKEVIESHGLTVTNFVNPGHTTNEHVRSFIKRYYRSARSQSFSGNRNLPILNTYHLSAYASDTEVNMKNEVDTAETNNEWLIFYIHETDAAAATMYDAVIDYIQGKGISIVTTNQALDLIENVFEVGDATEGRSFAVNPAGDMRAKEVNAVGTINIWNPAWPYTHNVALSYSGADLKLSPYDDGGSRYVETMAGTTAFRPGDRRTTELGISTLEWATVWATGLSSSYEDVTIQAADDIYINTGGANTAIYIDDSQQVGIGYTGTLYRPLSIYGTSSTIGTGRSLGSFMDDTAQAAGVGGGFDFGGKYTDAGGYTNFAAIWSEKENSTTGQYGGLLKFGSRTHGSAIATRMTIGADGNVGIGTTSPGQLLHLYKSQNAPTVLRIENPTAGTAARAETTWDGDAGQGRIRVFSSTYTTSGHNIADSMLINADENLSGGLSLTANAATGVIRFFTGGWADSDEKVRITNTGNVGIGTVSPAYLLSVGSANNFGINSSGYALLPAGLVGTPSLSFTSDTNTGLWSSGADTLNFSTGGSERVRITTDGNVGIGDTDPDANLEVVDDFMVSATANGDGNLFIVNSSGNAGLGSITEPSANGGKVLFFGDNTADPTMSSNTAGLYGKDVGGTVEMFAVDEAGNAAQLTPHNFSLFSPKSSYTYPWSYYSKNPYIGKEINVDIYGAIKTIESLSGKTFIYEEDMPKNEIINWDEQQQINKEKIEAQRLEKTIEKIMEQEVEVMKIMAIDLVAITKEVEVDTTIEITYELNPLTGNLDEVETEVPVYEDQLTGEHIWQLKEGIRLDENTGLFYRNKTREEAEAEAEAVIDPYLIKELPKWIEDRVPVDVLMPK